MWEKTNTLQVEQAHKAINPWEGAAEVSGCASVGRECSEETRECKVGCKGGCTEISAECSAVIF